jgi:lincosamide nucleotidyltransferase B/F
MTVNTQALLTRLDEIGRSLERSGHALALLGLGSVGLELDRIDAYSDLDFFAIVEDGYKQAYIDSLDWLSGIHPVAYQFRNTVDGYKLLFADGIFCEFAVFELDELKNIPFAPGRIVWKRSDMPDTLGEPVLKSNPPSKKDKDFLLGEAVTNIYVGLQRDKRGEKLSAMRFIQSYAVDRLLELVEYIAPPNKAHLDPFVNERRFEQRYPGLVPVLCTWTQGYEKNRESALAILEFLENNFEVNQAMAKEIRELCN